MPPDDAQTAVETPPDDGVLIASDAAKLPEAVRALLDPSTALPADVEHFESRFDWNYISSKVLIGIGFGVATIVMVPFGVVMLFDRGPSGRGDVSFAPLSFGVVCGFVTYFMFAAARAAWSLGERQRRGERTRRGTFLTPDALVQATESDTTVIPRSAFRGLNGRTVSYELKAARKTFGVSADVIESTPADRHAAILAWASRGDAGRPPPLPAQVL